jgi:parallel beta-helix repeat protein
VTDSADPTLTGNRIAGNLGTGLTLENTSAGVLTGNSSTGNDDNGLRLNQSNGALIDGNDFSTNGGFGMRIDRSTADFDAAPGAQGAPGNNDVSDNRKGELRLD